MALDELCGHDLLDAHVHLGFARDPRQVARDAQSRDLALFSVAVTPAEFERMRQELCGFTLVRQGLGLHPWWVDDGRCTEQDLERFLGLLGETSWVGECGLDFSRRCHDHETQRAAFRRICEVVGRQGGKVLSLHAVRSVTCVLDILEATGCTDSCTCILHWFSGSTEELWRAIRLGCHFSVNEMQARTRRAREQLRLIPEDRLLFETDLPEGEGADISAEEIARSLMRARELAEGIRTRPR